MKNYLAVLQFPFLFISHFIIGLGVYGSEFSRMSGKINLALVLIIPVVFILYRFLWVQKIIALTIKPLQLVGALAGLYLYSLLHLSYWNEHSNLQAGLLLLIGVVSLVTALQAMQAVASQSTQASFVILLIAFVFLLNSAYPLFAFVVLSFIFLWLLLSPAPIVPSTLGSIVPLEFNHKVILFLVFFEAFTPVWDYQEVLKWAYLLFWFFVAFAFSIAIRKTYQEKLNICSLQIIAITLIILSVVMPSWVLTINHALVFGLLAGALLVVYEQRTHISKLLATLSLTWLLVGFISYGLYQNITIMEYRLVLLLVFVVPAYKALRKNLSS